MPDLVAEMRKAGDEVVNGNMGRVERMLANQAMTLDAFFNNMAQRSHSQETFKDIEVLMRLALNAQPWAKSTGPGSPKGRQTEFQYLSTRDHKFCHFGGCPEFCVNGASIKFWVFFPQTG